MKTNLEKLKEEGVKRYPELDRIQFGIEILNTIQNEYGEAILKDIDKKIKDYKYCKDYPKENTPKMIWEYSIDFIVNVLEKDIKEIIKKGLTR